MAEKIISSFAIEDPKYEMETGRSRLGRIYAILPRKITKYTNLAGSIPLNASDLIATSKLLATISAQIFISNVRIALPLRFTPDSSPHRELL